MTMLAHKLRERIQIQRLDQVPNDDGGYDEDFITLATIWAGFRPMSNTLRIIGGQHQPIASVEMSGGAMTHEFLVRRIAVQNLGKEYNTAFDSDEFDGNGNYHPIQGNFYIFVNRNGSSSKGRRFRVGKTVDADERREFIKILAEEIEEKGAGDYPIL